MFLVPLVLLGVAWRLVQGKSEHSSPPKRVDSSEPTYAVRPRGTVVFSRQIAPILFTHCAPCHRPNQAAPFPLLSYRDAQKHARELVDVTQSGYMPPWLPASGFGHFIDERHLTGEEKGLIRQWVAEGAIEGNPAETPPLPNWPDGWYLGKPDLVVQMPREFRLTPDGEDVYRNFVVPLDLPRDRYVRAFEFLPQNQRIVHHAFIQVSSNKAARRQEKDAEIPGFDGMDIQAETPPGQFLAWQPGKIPTAGPAGLPWKLPAGSDLVLQVHMNKTGKPETLRSSVGLYFTDTPPTNTIFKMELCSLAIDLPAGASNVVVTDTFTLPCEVDILSVLPHAHFLAKEMKGWATLPDGKKEWLLWIPKWDFKWQGDYRYSNPVHLPVGSVLHMEFTYDNSERNPLNPHHPPRRVAYGAQTSDEMAELWFQILPGTENRVAALEKANQGHLWTIIRDRAVHLLAVDPDNAMAHVEMGKYLITQKNHLEAEHEFRRAIELRSDTGEAHFQLGMLLRFEGKTVAARRELQTAIRLNPENSMAFGHLGFVMAEMGELAEAERCFRQTLELDPGDALVANALAQLLQSPKRR